MRINQSVFDSTIGTETILLNENTGQLFLLNQIAGTLWLGLKSNISTAEIADFISTNSGVSAAEIRNDLKSILDDWSEFGLLTSTDEQKSVGGHELSNPYHSVDEFPSESSYANAVDFVGTFGVGDVVFDIHSTTEEARRAADQVFNHVRIEPRRTCSFRLTIKRKGQRWLLYYNGEYKAHCQELEQLAPLLHANSLLCVYEHSSASIALHAAAIAVGQDSLILPARSGAGKSTLSAALMSAGFSFCSDELVLLYGPELSVIPASFCIGLKEGAWDVVSAFAPQVASLATHTRIDGKKIRYLPPISKSKTVGRDERLKTKFMVFPRYDPDSECDHRTISPAKALLLMTDAGYDTNFQVTRTLLRQLTRWIENIHCVELRYDNLDFAVDYVESLYKLNSTAPPI